MVEAAPAASLVVTKPDFLLEFLIVALNAPAQLDKIDEPREADVLRQRREPVPGRLGFPFGPLDQQPFRMQLLRDQLVMSDTNAYTREARGQPVGGAFPPLHRAPSPLRQTKHDLLGRDQIRLVTTAGIVQRLAFAPRPG